VNWTVVIIIIVVGVVLCFCCGGVVAVMMGKKKEERPSPEEEGIELTVDDPNEVESGSLAVAWGEAEPPEPPEPPLPTDATPQADDAARNLDDTSAFVCCAANESGFPSWM
jgi:hypothetical protein